MIINGHEFAVNAAFEEMLAESLKVRPCSYDPTKHLEIHTDSTGAVIGVGLSLDSKCLWFAAYCNETGKVGRIIPELLDKDFRQIEVEIEENGQKVLSPRYYTSAKADIYLNSELVATGFASDCFPRTDKEIRYANQRVTRGAISNALSNAGFGVIDFGKLADPAPKNPGPDANAPLPFTVGTDPEIPAPISAPTAAPAVQNPAPNPPVQQNEMQSLFAQLGGVDDELSRAKTIPYPLRGLYAGRSLGELPTTALETLVKKQVADPKVQAAQKAAQLILEDRKKANGKAFK